MAGLGRKGRKEASFMALVAHTVMVKPFIWSSSLQPIHLFVAVSGCIIGTRALPKFTRDLISIRNYYNGLLAHRYHD